MSRGRWPQNLDEYWSWIEQTVNGSGAELDRNSIDVEPLTDADGNQVGWLISEHQLTFHDRAVLVFDFIVSSTLDLDEYSFHYQDSAGNLIWRKDKQEGHERIGGNVHIHRLTKRGQVRREPYQEVDLQEAIGEVNEPKGDLLSRILSFLGRRKP